MKKFIPFLIVFLLTFYVLPFAILSKILLFAATPILLLLTGIVFGGFFGFSILLAILCVVCAIPLVLVYGTIFFVYILVFFAVTSIGNLLGLIFRKKTE